MKNKIQNCIIFVLLVSGQMAMGQIKVTEKLREDGLTELKVISQDGKTLETYNINLSKHHHPATEKTGAIKRWESYRFGALISYNTNQFSGKEICLASDPNIYHPTDLNVPGWAEAMQSAGMKYAVLTTRHTSGFLLWDSPTTDFDVAASPVKTDVVGAYVESCRKAGIAPGLYYCLWGGQWKPDPNARAIILAQLCELATNYGEIPYFWIDMKYWGPNDLSTQEIYDLLKNLQPETVVIMNQHVQDGTKINYFPTDVLNGEITLPPEKGHQPNREVEGKTYYLPFEFEPVSQIFEGESVAKTHLGAGSWFTYGSGKSFTASEPLDAEDLYEWIKQAYDRGASNVLLSMAPDHTGSIRKKDAAQLKKLGQLLNKKP